MIPAKVRLLIDWIHIREAERRGRRVSPVELALIEQSRFTRFELQAGAVVLENPDTGESVRYLPCPEMALFLEQFGQGTATYPTSFILSRIPETGESGSRDSARPTDQWNK